MEGPEQRWEWGEKGFKGRGPRGNKPGLQEYPFVKTEVGEGEPSG